MRCLILIFIVALLGIVQAGHEHRKLLNTQAIPANRAANTMRAQAATSEAILRAVDSGARLSATHRAADVGSVMAWAAGQRDQHVFDIMEQTVAATPWDKK